MSEPPSKRQRTNFWAGGNAVEAFEANEADEGGDDEEWDDDIDEDVDDASFERHRQDVENRYKRREPATLNQDILRGNDQSSNRNSLLDRLAQKYGNTGYDEASDAGTYHQSRAGATSMRGNQSVANYANSQFNNQSQRPGAFHHGEHSVSATLPSVQDPGLWLVPCLPGKERYAVEEILKKYFKYVNHQTKKLFIKTAFTTDMNTGYIYVEAFKEIHVRRACEDISGLNTWKLRLVPRSEMVDALTIKAAGPQIKRGQWCRFQRGLYKGDLAQVYAIMDQGSKVVLRVAPRIDYGKLSILNQTTQDGRRRGTGFVRGKGRSAQKLFNKADIEMYDDARPPEVVNQDPILATRIIKWRGKKYKNGCQLVTVPVSQVEFDVTASPEEVDLLRSKTADCDYDDEADDDMEEVAPPIFQKSCIFVRGDTVKAIRGAMTNLIGEVLTTHPNPVTGKITVTVLPEHKELNEAVPFPAEELQKYFKAGCHVKVKRGKFKDETGLIVLVEEETGNKEGDVLIYSDLTNRSIRCHINDITETSEVSTGRDVLGNYALFELVHLSRDVVGVIVSIQNGQFKILDNKDTIQTCRLPDIARHSKDEHAVALDIDNNQIRIGDVILPQVGDFKGQRSTVKHVYRSVLFCHTKSCNQNAGIFVCRSRLCRLAGGRVRNNSSMTQGRTTTGNDRRLRSLHQYRATRDPWMHKTVKIRRGNYKGLVGIVCSATDQKLNIELSAKCKKIQIKREDVRVINQDGSEIQDGDIPYSNMQQNNGSRNSFGNNRSSGYGNNYGQPMRSSNYNDRGRMRAAATPLIGVSTPAHSSYSDERNIGAATPALGSQTPGIGGQTPGIGGMTPAYGGMTPAHSGGGGSGAWNVGGQTPAHNPVTSPAFTDSRPGSHSTYSSNTTPAHSTNYHSTPSAYSRVDAFTPHSAGNESPASSTSGMSETASQSGDEIQRQINRNPNYFIVKGAIVMYDDQSHNLQSVVVHSVDIGRNVCSVAVGGNVIASNVPLHLISFSELEQDSMGALGDSKVMVVLGKMKGELGQLIGIDGAEAVVQLDATTEVNILNKRAIVLYMEPNDN